MAAGEELSRIPSNSCWSGASQRHPGAKPDSTESVALLPSVLRHQPHTTVLPSSPGNQASLTEKDKTMKSQEVNFNIRDFIRCRNY